MKRVLLLSTSAPATGSGTGERSLSIFNAISKVAETHVVRLYTGGRKPEPSPDWTTLPLFEPGQDTQWYWRRRKYLLEDFRVDARLLSEVRRLHEKHKFDAFFCRYFSVIVAGCDQLGPTLLDFDDLPATMPGPRIPGWRRLGWELTTRRLSSFRTVFVTKGSDVPRLQHPDVRVLPCISTVRPPPETGSNEGIPFASAPAPRILFVGSIAWPPNREGLMRFIRDVLPAIRRRVPGATLRVVGEGTTSLAGLEGVSGAGFVDDLAAEYVRATIVICPIFSGAGANVKLAEAAQFGKAIVASADAAKGFEGILEPDRDLWVARSDEQMTEMCGRLLTDETVRETLGRQARTTAEKSLSQAAIDRIVAQALTECWR
jgi:glycosyltransferase involved in cell wall biosynthesis